MCSKKIGGGCRLNIELDFEKSAKLVFQIVRSLHAKLSLRDVVAPVGGGCRLNIELDFEKSAKLVFQIVRSLHAKLSLRDVVAPVELWKNR